MTVTMYFGGAQPHNFTNGQNFDLDLGDTQAITLLQQQNLQHSQLLSPTQNQHRRHDSGFGISPSSSPKSGGMRQEHQAESHPYVSPTQPTSHLQDPVTMQRSTSYYSTSSGQHPQQNVPQHRASFDDDSRPIAISMSRASTQQSSGSPGYHFQAVPQPHASSSISNQHYNTSVMERTRSAFASNHESYDRARSNTVQSTYDYNFPDLLDTNLVDMNSLSRLIGQDNTSTESNVYPSIGSLPSQFRHESRHRPALPNKTSPASTSPNSDSLTLGPHILPTSPPLTSRSPHTLLPRRRRRRSSPSLNSSSDPVIGQVTNSGKFKCLDSVCSELTFGRQADFRRHWENVHASKKYEFFCPSEGCPRSKKPSNSSKGRSFGSREDKMKEHFWTVHDKARKRKRDALHEMNSEAQIKGEESSSDMDFMEESKPKKKRNSGTYNA